MSESLMSWAKEAKNKKYVILIMGLIAIIILVTFYPFKDPNDAKGKIPIITGNEKEQTDPSGSYEDKLERKLKNILSNMEGVGAVDVMVTTISTEEKVIAQNVNRSEQQTEEKDQAGGTRTTKQSQNNTDIVLQDGNVPYITKENSPEIKGVFILAQGAEDSRVKGQIIEAVSKLLDVPVHKISVEKKKN